MQDNVKNMINNQRDFSVSKHYSVFEIIIDNQTFPSWSVFIGFGR